MKYSVQRRWLAMAPALLAGLLWLAAYMPAAAGPGAHGPNGEHLDAPTAPQSAAALPRMETNSDTFELVAELRSGTLTILIDRYLTNEPVLGAKVEVESGELKAVAAFRGEQGDYVVADAKLLARLATPGEHPLVFTVVAAADTDLLDGKWIKASVAAGGAGHHDHAHDHPAHDHQLLRAGWIGAGVAALGAGAIIWWRRRRADAANAASSSARGL